MIIKVERIPRAGETIFGGEFVTAPGGKGANQAVAVARAGGAVKFVARLGRDMFGDRSVASLVANGVDVRHVIRDPTSPSGVALIFVGESGENSIAVAAGANGKLRPADIREARTAFHEVRIALLQLEIPLKTVVTTVELANSAGVPVVLNPAPARPLPSRLLRAIYLLTPNECEAQFLTGQPVTNEASAARAAAKLLARGVQNVIITMGARGAFVAGKKVRRLIPSHSVNAIDATGAGDVFNGALAVALAEGKALVDAARFAVAAAAISVTRIGAQASIPRRREIDRMLATAGIHQNSPLSLHNEPKHSPNGSAENRAARIRQSQRNHLYHKTRNKCTASPL